MKVILVNGSPRKKGCTNRALEEIKVTLEKEGIETVIFHVDPKVVGCNACGYCKKENKCIYNDCVNEFVEMAKDADGFVFGSPVYYGGPSGEIMSFMDRVCYSSARQTLYHKPVASVVSCRRGGNSQSFSQLNMYYLMNNMIVIGSQYWNMVHGNTVSEVEQDTEGLQTMRTLAKNMAWILKSIEVAKKSGIEKPSVEARLATNFIR